MPRPLEAYNRALAAYAVQDPISSGVNLVFGDARVREAIAVVNEKVETKPTNKQVAASEVLGHFPVSLQVLGPTSRTVSVFSGHNLATTVSSDSWSGD